MAGSEHSPVKDINTLKYGYSTQEVMKMREYVDMMTAVETAGQMDQKLESDRAERKNAN